MRYNDVFKMPTKVTISGRSSTITNSFVISIIPNIEPTEEEIRQCLDMLGLKPDNLRCAYCGDPATEWDHLRPVVSNKKPTGYISEIRNLVPACGKCNQSKGNKRWNDWIRSAAKKSPKTRGVEDLATRIINLERYEKWGQVSPIDFEGQVDANLWKEHWNNLESMHKEMKRCQKLAEEINASLAEKSRLRLSRSS